MNHPQYYYLTLKSNNYKEINIQTIKKYKFVITNYEHINSIMKEFYFEVKPYPHHMLRENKMLSGAGADRMQTGMAHSFGRTVGRAALVKKNQVIIIIKVLNESTASSFSKTAATIGPLLIKETLISYSYWLMLVLS